MELDEIEIVKRIRDGDVSAYENIFQRHYGTLCLFAKKIVGNIDEARDIVQEIFVTLYANRESLQMSTSLKSYLFKCVYNACLNSLKRHRIHDLHHEYLKLHLPFTDDHDAIVKAELETKIRITVEQLPEQCRKIFSMNRYEGKKNSEIAGELGLSIRTVETQISKALSILRTKLADFLASLLLAILS